MTNPDPIPFDSNSGLNLTIVIAPMLLGLFLLSIYLWIKTPDLFLYFNQAFCAH